MGITAQGKVRLVAYSVQNVAGQGFKIRIIIFFLFAKQFASVGKPSQANSTFIG